jgi:polyhydroxyalkanoate synthesis repressor PhaR
MGSEKQPITIKKYANRRLYNTGTSTYVTLEDLAEMVKKGEDFVVFDAKSGEEITRSVLTQIIFEQEGKGGQSLLPITFLRQLIRFYGDSIQMLVPSYLEFSIDRLTSDQEKFRDQFADGLGAAALGAQGAGMPGLGAPGLGSAGLGAAANPTLQIFDTLEEQTRKNMAMFTQALSMFTPFGVAPTPSQPSASTTSSHAEPAPQSAVDSRSDIEEMKRQLGELQKRIEGIVSKE